MNLMPLVSSNLCAARIRPRLPSLMRSESETPWFWYFLATLTTKRRLERTSLSSASASLRLIRWASSTSSSRVISGYWLISRRYWSSDPSSKDTRLAVFSRIPESSVNERSEPAPPNVRQPRKRVVRPPVITEIDQQRPPFHRGSIHEAPIPGVRGIVAVVAQHEVLPHRYDQRAPLVSLRMIAAAILLRARQVELTLPLEVGTRHVAAGIDALHVRLAEPMIVDEDMPAPHGDRVPGRADHALHVVLAGIARKREHDHIAARRVAESRQSGPGPGDLRPVQRLVDEQKIAREKRVRHAATGDLKCFEEKRLDDEEQHERHADR